MDQILQEEMNRVYRILMLREKIETLKKANESLKKTEIHYYGEIRSKRKVIGWLLYFFRRTQRRLLRFLVQPIVDECNRSIKQISCELNTMIETTETLCDLLGPSDVSIIGMTEDDDK